MALMVGIFRRQNVDYNKFLCGQVELLQAVGGL